MAKGKRRASPDVSWTEYSSGVVIAYFLVGSCPSISFSCSPHFLVLIGFDFGIDQWSAVSRNRNARNLSVTDNFVIFICLFVLSDMECNGWMGR